MFDYLFKTILYCPGSDSELLSASLIKAVWQESKAYRLFTDFINLLLYICKFYSMFFVIYLQTVEGYKPVAASLFIKNQFRSENTRLSFSRCD